MTDGGEGWGLVKTSSRINARRVVPLYHMQFTPGTTVLARTRDLGPSEDDRCSRYVVHGCAGVTRLCLGGVFCISALKV